jgi:hypothetical protein
MRRPPAPLASIASLGVAGLLVLACSDGGESASVSQACPIDIEQRTPSNNPLPQVSLEEAQERAQFELLLPEDLPDGVEVDSVLLYPDLYCPDEVLRAELLFTGQGYIFTLTESDRGIGIGGPTEPITINGVEGEMSTHDVPGYPRLKAVAWIQGGRGFIADPVLSDTLTEERFLEILESIPE